MAKTQSSLSPSPSSPSTLIWNLNEDVLGEVFVRLPHRRSLIQCSLVCKKWFSVISCPNFTQEFIKFHLEKRCSNSDSNASSYSLPYSISFTPTVDYEGILFGQILSKKSKILLRKQPEFSLSSSSSSSGLYRNIWPANMRIRALCNDLLLISKSAYSGDRYHIYNPLTRQLFPLPIIPGKRLYGSESCGFICELKNDLYRFKVLIFESSSVHENDYQRKGVIFCSETGKWSNLILSFPHKLCRLDDFVTSNGILYAPEKWKVKGFVAINLSVDDSNPKQCRYIEGPNDFKSGWRANRDKVCYGVVRGKLRLAQIFYYDTKEYELKVWELMDMDNNWVLKHRITLTPAKTGTKVLAAFHPYNGNVIFISHNDEIYKYKIEEKSYSHKRVCELQGPDLPSKKNIMESSWKFFKAFTLVYPPWPTPIPIPPNV